MLKKVRIRILHYRIARIEGKKITLEENITRNPSNPGLHIAKLIKLTQNLQKKRQKLRQLNSTNINRW
jgi:hypothetical protein